MSAMNRVVLTMLALMAGLFAQTTPAQARICMAGEAQVSVDASQVAAREVAQGQVATGLRARRDVPARVRSCLRVVTGRVYIPSVQLQADRAHE